MGTLTALDRSLFLSLFGGEQPGFALYFMVALTVIGRGYVLWILASLAFLPTSASRYLPVNLFNPRVQRIAREMLVVLVGVALLVYLGKAIVQRPRPYVAFNLVPLGGPPPRDFSFPSGHAAGAFGFALFLCARLPLRSSTRFGLLVVAIGIGISRIYLGAHFPTDVLAGGLLGSAAGWLAGARLRRFELAQLANPPRGEA